MVVTPDKVIQDQKAWINVYQKATVLRREYDERRKIFLPGHASMKKLQIELRKAEAELNQHYDSAYASFLLSHSKTVTEGNRLRDQLPLLREVTRSHEQAETGMDHIQSKIQDLQKCR